MSNSNKVTTLNAGIMSNEYNPTDTEELGACINEKKVELETLHGRLEELEGKDTLGALEEINVLHQDIHALESEIEIDEGKLTDLYDQE